MGGCRMLNVLLGMSVAAAAWQSPHWLVAGGIGTYIVGVTWFARGEAGQSSRLQLGLATAVMMAGIALLARLPAHADNLVLLLQRQPERWTLLMMLLGMLIGWRCFRAVLDPIPARVQMAVTHCILSLVILDAAACYAVRGTFWAVMVLLLLAPAMLLGQWIRST
jgi:4-hydroxybenzoate polyprenyltransferase